MGTIYLAHDEFLDRDVAIKFVATTDNEHAAARFRTEARAIARLQHANVVTIYRVGTVLDQPYIVSELVLGRPLGMCARLLPAGRLVGAVLGLDRLVGLLGAAGALRPVLRLLGAGRVRAAGT